MFQIAEEAEASLVLQSVVLISPRGSGSPEENQARFDLSGRRSASVAPRTKFAIGNIGRDVCVFANSRLFMH